MCTCRDYRCLGLDESEFTKSVIQVFIFLLYYDRASVNSVVVTVLHLLRALLRRITVYRILPKIERIRASLVPVIYDNKLADCLLSR